MKRIWVAFLTIVIYALAQFLPLLAQQLPFFKDLKGMELAKGGVYTQVILFVIAALLIIWLNSIIKIQRHWSEVIKNLNATFYLGLY